MQRSRGPPKRSKSKGSKLGRPEDVSRGGGDVGVVGHSGVEDEQGADDEMGLDDDSSAIDESERLRYMSLTEVVSMNFGGFGS